MYAVSYHWASECRGRPSKDEPAYPNAFDHCDMYMNIHFSLAFQHIFKNHIFFLNSLCIKEHFHWSSCKWSEGTLWCAIISYLLLSLLSEAFLVSVDTCFTALFTQWKLIPFASFNWNLNCCLIKKGKYLKNMACIYTNRCCSLQGMIC